MKKFPVIIGISMLLLSACSFGGSDEETGDQNSSASSSSAATVNETKNVLYSGTVRSAGVTIFMQGTHKLILEDGRFILLESDTVELGDYIGEEVEVFGAVRPTVEEGGLIMRVERVTRMEESSSSASSEAEESSSSSEAASSTSSEEASSSSVEASSSSLSSQAASSSVASTATSESSTWQASSELQAKAEVMAREDMSASNWTQEYCSSHVLFCIPVHRNWWFKSFGATSSTFWHVEVGPEEMNNLGEGPISINLVSGAVASAGASDGEVRVQGGSATGFKAWDDSRHFEIVGPANLEAAIRFMISGLRKTEG